MNTLFGTGQFNQKELFETVKTIAIIGCSSNPYRTSHHIAKYLKDNGFEIIPVNPNETRVLGEKCYDSLADIPEGRRVDLVDIFRNKRYTPEVVREIIDWGDKRGVKPVIWTQLDVSTDSAREMAEEHGYTYVENRCIMVDHRNL